MVDTEGGYGLRIAHVWLFLPPEGCAERLGSSADVGSCATMKGRAK
jgi:hypothetical protein